MEHRSTHAFQKDTKMNVVDDLGQKISAMATFQLMPHPEQPLRFAPDTEGA